MKHLTRTFLSVLSLLAVFSAAACGSETSEAPADTVPYAPVSEETASADALSFPDTIPADAFYNGADFRIAYSNAWEMNECVYTLDDAAGDLVNEAVYQRNLKTEEKLGVRISGDWLCKWDEIAVNLQKMVQAGDCPYDIIMASEVQLFRASLNDLLLDMDGIDTLDLTHSWWDTEALDMYSLGTKNRFLISGTVNYLDDYSQNCLLFNKKLCAQYDLEEPYALVREGRWTFDKFMEYVMKFGVDLDGDGRMNENDLYGYLGNVGAINNFLYGAGEGIITFDAEGNAGLNTSDRMQTVIAACIDRLLDKNNNAVCIIERKIGYDRAGSIFPNGFSLFLGNTFVGEVADMRLAMEDDFGIIPYPKFDEAQENYYSSLDIVYGTVVSVPAANADPARTGWVLDLMGYYSEEDLLPTVIEKHIKTKSMRDEDSVEMLNLIIGAKSFNLGGWGSSIYTQMMNMCQNGKNNYASLAEKYRSITKEEFSAVAEVYDFGK